MKKINLGFLSLFSSIISIVTAIIVTWSSYDINKVWLVYRGVSESVQSLGFLIAPLAWILALMFGLLSSYFEKGNAKKLKLAKVGIIASLLLALFLGFYIAYLLKHACNGYSYMDCPS